MSEEIATLLREMIIELRGLRGDLRRGKLSVSESDENLIREIQSVTGDRDFAAAEIIGAAAIIRSLRIALEAYGVIDARRLGKVLQRIDGYTLAGLRIERLGQDGTGAIWRVKGVVGVTPLTPTKPVAANIHRGLS
jgi:hypothetical protein